MTGRSPGRVPREGAAPAFTLVEMLVALVLAVLVGATAFAVFSGGFRIWGRLAQEGVRAREVQLALEQLRQDLANVRPFKPIPFRGGYDEISFPGLVPMTWADRRSGEETEVEEIGQIGYFHDPYRRMLCRSRVAYRQIRRVRLREGCQTVLTGVERVRFSYAAPQPDGTGSGWNSRWESESTPLAVKIEVAVRDVSTNQTQTQTVVVPLAVGQAEPS